MNAENDIAILIALDTMPRPVATGTVALYAKRFWRTALPEDEAEAAREVRFYTDTALERLKGTGDVQMTPNRFTGPLWSLTDQGRANARQ